MNDSRKESPKPISMKSVDGVGFTFATSVVAVGHHNGVVNVTLAAFAFTPTFTLAPKSDSAVDADPVVVSRLRLDMSCAIALRDNLMRVIDSMTATRIAVPDGNAEEVQPEVQH